MRIGARRSTRGLALILAVAGCVTACGEEGRVGYTFYAEEPDVGPALLAIEVSDGETVRRLAGSEFVLSSGGRLVSPEFETPTSGDLVTTFRLMNGEDTLSSGELRLELRPDWQWGISFQRADEDPTATCFGCMGSRAYGLDPTLQESPADSLWVWWGGNSISNPVVY